MPAPPRHRVTPGEPGPAVYRGGMPHRLRPHARPTARACLAVGVVALAAALVTGCAGTPDPSQSEPTASSDASASAAATPTPGPSLAPFPMGPSTSTTALPADLPQGCRDLLDADVLAQLDGVPLNAEGMGGGIRSDSSRVCVWGEPGAAATWLVTVIGYSPDREARDALYELGNEGYTCYEPRGGIRCESTWENGTLPLQQGRTLFYRDGVIVDTQFSNLAPAGYTDSVIDALWLAATTP